MTIRDAITAYSAKLQDPQGYLAVEALLAHVLGKPREYLLEYPEKNIPFFRFCYFRFLFSRLQTGFPLAYLTGHKEFFGLDFKVNKHTLIPRPETELLVDEVLELVTESDEPISSVIDIGTGSGAIIVSVAKTLIASSLRGSTAFFASDASASALRVAKKNAKRNGVAEKITFLKGDLLCPIFKSKVTVQESIIVANLPYLNVDEMSESSIRFEPRLALYGGTDGLDLYRILLKQLADRSLAPRALVFEIGHRQGQLLTNLINHLLPGYTVAVHQDYCGIDRMVTAVRK